MVDPTQEAIGNPNSNSLVKMILCLDFFLLEKAWDGDPIAVVVIVTRMVCAIGPNVNSLPN